MKKLIKKILSLGSYILAAAAVIIALSSGTYAWLKQNAAVSSSGLPYLLDDSRGISIQNVEIYKRDGKEGARLVTEADRIDMTEYDTIFTDRNVDTPIIYRIILDPVPAGRDIKWTVQCLEVSRSWTDTGTAEGKMKQYYSNISAIKIGTGTAELNALTEPEAVYTGAIAHLAEDGVAASRSFATDRRTGDARNRYEHVSKVDELSDTVTVKSSDIHEGKLVLYMQLSYNPELVASAMEDYETGGSGTTLDEAVNYQNDMSAVRFEYIEQ